MSAIGESAPDPTRPQSLSRADQRALQHTKKSRDREATHLASSKDKVRRLATADRFFDNQQFLQEQIAYQQESTARASLIAAHQAEINRLQCLYTVALPESKEGTRLCLKAILMAKPPSPFLKPPPVRTVVSKTTEDDDDSSAADDTLANYETPYMPPRHGYGARPAPTTSGSGDRAEGPTPPSPPPGPIEL